VFVTREFATREIEDPMPGLNSRIIASIANGASVVRPEADLYNACADQPLDVVTLFGNWIDGLSAEQVRQIQTAFPMSFIEAHLGYRLNRLFQENAGDAQHNYIESSGVWRITKRYTDCERALAVMTRSDAFSVSGSIAASLFQYQEPILGLRDGEKHLLVEALTRRSDDELAKGMNLSPATVKKRWQALFERVTDKHPTLLPSDGDESSKLTRGPQKRHHILAYVRSHPQELRPYRWRSVKDA
jgi:DNA-binding CsgD family transcriptional regulator